ncbi:Protein of unknown function [Gryllus bimaculatus]|nr:Protein of unknown function [Gryllus bimaculatus]
MAVLWGQVVD